MVEIEAHLDNRTLTYVSADSNEPTLLTPSQLLYGRMVNTVPHPRTEHDEITDEDYYEARDLHHSLSKPMP